MEKNLNAFLSLDLPGTKVIIGKGPVEADLKRRFPQVKFLGQLENGTLAAHLAAADVFVFPSRTDTFGVVQLEALASGVPIAAFPVTGPKDVIADNPIGVLNEDLRAACLARCKSRATPAARSRCTTPGKTARANSSGMSARWRSTDSDEHAAAERVTAPAPG